MKLPFDPEQLQHFWEENRHVHPADVLLRTKEEDRERVKLLLNQVGSRKRLILKVPEWATRFDLDLPPESNLSQSSSTLTAQYKAQFVQGHVLDLTSGSGVDSWQFGQKAERLTLVEPNPNLLSQTSGNLVRLGIEHTAVQTTAESYIHSTENHFNCIYVDPSRRDEGGKKTVALHRMAPDLTSIWENLLNRAELVMIKLSPLFDLAAISAELKGVFAIDVVSKKGEVKEILVRARKGYSGEIAVSYAEVDQSLNPVFSSDLSTIQSGHNKLSPGSWNGFLYDPAPGLVKSGLCSLWALDHKLFQPFKGVLLFTSEKKLEYFPGRVFKIVQTGNPYKLKGLPKQLSIVTRNYFESPERIRKRLKVKESDDHFLFACTENRKKSIFIHTLRVS